MNEPRVDFRAIKAAALAAADSLVSSWLPGGRREGAEWCALNPLREDAKEGSFKVNLQSGIWADFATGDKGGDLIALYAYLNRLSQLEAARVLGAELRVLEPPAPGREPSAPVPPAGRAEEEKWRAIVPVPEDAPAPPEAHWRHGPYSRRWTYRDAAGRVLCYVSRFDPASGRKQIGPLTYCEHQGEGGRREWRWKALPAPRPLYRLDALAARRGAPVLICEGEKDADAAQELMPEWVTTCSPNGSKAARQADWSALDGRRVAVWPDYDAPGREYMQDIARLLKERAASLEEVTIPLAGTPLPDGTLDSQSREPAAGWGAADAVAEGWTAAHLAALAAGGVLLAPLVRVVRLTGLHGALVLPEQLHRPGERAQALDRESADLHPETGQPWPPIIGGWRVSNDGVQEPGKVGSPGGLISLRPIWVHCTTTQRVGREEIWGFQVRFYTIGWRLRSRAMLNQRIGEHGGVLGQELLAMGLPIVAGKEKMLSRYLEVQMTQVPNVRATNRLGWLDEDADGPRAFVMPDQVIGGADPIVYQPDAPNMEYLAATLHARGTLDDWRREVAGLCDGNPVLVFFLCAGFAPPLMRFVEAPSGGFHLAGGSTTGKTTALQVAVTCWGCGADPQSGPQHTAIRRWKATGNAIEAIADMHNHMLLALDEINEVDPRELGGIIYQLAGGQSKGRATVHGGLRSPRHWQLLYLSTGERSIDDILRQAGHRLQGGQQVRLPEIPAEDPRSGAAAVIEDPHGLEPSVFAEQVKAGCARYYGTAGPTFVAYLIRQVEAKSRDGFSGELKRELKHIEETLMARLDKIGEPVDGAHRRVLKQFALVILAGAHAQLAGILDGDITRIYAAGEAMVLRWIRHQGEERSEIERSLAAFRDALISRISSFVDLFTSANDITARDVIGFRRQGFFLLLERGFAELTEGYDGKAILRALKARGHLQTDPGKFKCKTPEIAAFGGKRLRVYAIRQEFLEGGDTEEGPGDPPPEAPAAQSRLPLDAGQEMPW